MGHKTICVDKNTGNNNTGNYNVGHQNSGNLNVGSMNSGSCNTGHYNSGNDNTGFFNTDSPKARCFNQECDIDVMKIKFPGTQEFTLTEFKDDKLVTYDYKEAWKNFWNSINDDRKQEFLNLPNFDSKIFEEITGIKVEISNSKQIQILEQTAKCLKNKIKVLINEHARILNKIEYFQNLQNID